MSKHTKGPWRIADTGGYEMRTGDCTLHPQIWAEFRVALCEQQNAGRSEAQANARLIAAAPDLLEACKAQHHAIDLLCALLIKLDPEFRPSKAGILDALVQGNAAIQKAGDSR